MAILAVPFVIGVILVAIQRLGGLILLMAYFAMAPVCIAAWISPDFKMIAHHWVRNFVGYSLWGVGYSLAIKMVAILILGVEHKGAPIQQIGDQFIQGLAGIAGIGVLLKVPAIIQSVVGGLSPGESGATGLADKLKERLG